MDVSARKMRDLTSAWHNLCQLKKSLTMAYDETHFP
jgi:hypothetical protein